MSTGCSLVAVEADAYDYEEYNDIPNEVGEENNEYEAAAFTAPILFRSFSTNIEVDEGETFHLPCYVSS